MSRLSDAFASAAVQRRAALVGYLPAGFPSPSAAGEAFRALVDGGVDVVEVGLPYSDPLLDGPVIQQAADAALRAGTTPADVLRTVERVAALGVAVVVMTYWNPVERYGAARFAAQLKEAGGSGVITPDLTPEEGAGWVAELAEVGLDPVFLVAPSSTRERIALVARTNRGFVYAASTMGVTGTRAELSAAAPGLVRRVRDETDLPVAVGLGVSNGEQAATVAAYADGVIVGSAFVRVLLDDPRDTGALHALAAELADGVRSPR